MARRGGRPSRNAKPRTPTPEEHDVDQDMVDAEEVDVATPQEDEEGVGTPAQESAAGASDDAGSPPVVQQFPRKRRLGRPPKNRPPDWSEPDGGSEGGTPRRRGRGRPSGGFRGRPRGGPSHTTRVPIDKEGNMMDVIDDEVALPEDPEGEQKVDKMGNLLGGRDYRVRVFTITGRGDRLYMLSTEPARCCGFRDSYLFFTKHMQLYKIIIEDKEKHDLIAREIIPHSYKGRAIGVVTARSVFREFGPRIVIGGKKVVDDYYAQAARDRGDVEGELADPEDRLPGPGEPYNKNQYVAWHGASSVYHQSGPTVPLQNGKGPPVKKKVNITSANWMFEHARAASRFNSRLAADRRANLNGTYNIHSNMMLYPKITQPTHARWEQVEPAEPQPKSLTNGDSMHLDGSKSAKFPSLPPVITRNFRITDIQYQSPSATGLGIPGLDGDHIDVGSNGLSSISDDIMDDLPDECRQAFLEAKKRELEWKNSWHSETVDGCRAPLKIGFSGVPV